MMINIFMTKWLRVLGSLLVAAGIATLVLGSIVGIGFWIYSLFLAQDYTLAVGTLGVILILGGFILRQIFDEKTS
jgi:hypothetical protein